MSLIRCPECNNEISDTSNSCIHCGYKLKKDSSKNKKLAIIAFIVIVLLLFLLVFSLMNKDNNDLHSCHDEDYFYKQIKKEIQDEYWEYDFIDVDNCNSVLLDEELDAWCHFKYKKNTNDNYLDDYYSETFSCSSDY